MLDVESMTAGKKPRSNAWQLAMTVTREADPPPGPANADAITSVVGFSPGAPGPCPHRRSGPASARVLDGETMVELEGEPPRPPIRTIPGVPIRPRDDVAVATAAGVAIGKTRPYDETRRRERWLEAAAEVSTAPLSGAELGEVTDLVAQRARQIGDAGHTDSSTPFNATAQRLVEAFAAQAAVALELADRRRDAERLAVLEDRDRIARDLHDTVIQRLFATAMTLMSAIKIVQGPEAASRIQRAVDDVDGTIRQIRSTIFALQAAPDDEGLRSRLHAVVDDAAPALGFAPSVRLDGSLDIAVPDETAEHLLAVACEALSNVARHARATSAQLAVELVDEGVVLCVEDDGVGIPAGGRRSGLCNMAGRAADLGGTFRTRPRSGGGTVLAWCAPLDT